MERQIGRNLSLELVRVTEAAALTAGRWMGRGQKEAADQAAVDAMRMVLNTIPMDGLVVIGEGTKDKAPMLYEGERLGCADEPKTDIAVDPIDGTRLLSQGMANSIATVAVAERGALFESPYVVYMEKLAVGPDAAHAIDINAPVQTNLENVAKALKRDVRDLVVVMLDRPRHAEMAEQVRAAGARIRFIMDGDVAGAVMATMPNTGIDMLMGIGGDGDHHPVPQRLRLVAKLDIMSSRGDRYCPERNVGPEQVNALTVDVSIPPGIVHLAEREQPCRVRRRRQCNPVFVFPLDGDCICGWVQRRREGWRFVRKQGNLTRIYVTSGERGLLAPSIAV